MGNLNEKKYHFVSSCSKSIRYFRLHISFVIALTFVIILVKTDFLKLNNPAELCLTPEVRLSLRHSEEMYKNYLIKRSERVKNKPESINPWFPHIYPYDYFLATFACPFSVQRIGALGDGGKWVCGIERFRKSPCILYSFGIATETSFEVEMLQRTQCEIFAFDASVNTVLGIPPEFQNRVHFSKLYGEANNSERATTLNAAMKRNGHTHIDILKIDVEGSEFPMLSQIISEFNNQLPFSQLLIEIHTKMTNGLAFAKLYRFFESLENSGLRPFRNELNIAPTVRNNGYIDALSEYSFINTNKLC